jgi:hypothetical protein
MAGEAVVPGLICQGNITLTGGGSILPNVTRANLELEQNVEHHIPFTQWRVWNAFETNLPGTAASDDLALIGGTFGTNAPSIQAGDLKAAGATTRYARCVVAVPHNFQTGYTVKIRVHAGMKTTVADVSCTVDFSAYRSGEDDTVGSDLVTTSATNINSLTEADFDFVVDAATLLPGDLLDIRMAIACNDGATATAVIPYVGSVAMLFDIRG